VKAIVSIRVIVAALAGSCVWTLGCWMPVGAQGMPDPVALQAAQRDAMKALAPLNGLWRGPATITRPDGSKITIMHTERIGPMLDGTLTVIEGRGYEADGRVSFNAFAVVSFDPAAKGYTMRAHAHGHASDFAFKPTADGFVWEIPAGPNVVRYTAVVKDGRFREVGEFIAPDKPPRKVFEMDLERLGSTDWPAGGAVPAR
jgi:hypothetical protein